MASERPPGQGRLTELVRRFPGINVLVVGDVVADRFVYGEISRVSREAPVMILRYESTQTLPGGAGNAASNIAALDASVALVGLVGRDHAGRATVVELRRRGIDTSGVIGVSGHTTPTKTRILAGSMHSLRQQVIRVDHEPPLAMVDEITGRLAARVREHAESADAIIISDYNYGVAGKEVIHAVHEAASRRGIPVLVDSRFRLTQFGGFTAATPNEDELEHLAGVTLATEAAVVEAGRRIAGALDLQALLVTRGSRGMLLFERGSEPLAIPIVGRAEAIDVTGAGDTVIATYALGLATGASFEEAAHLANHAGGLVVMKRGTATAGREELLASILRWHGTPE
jgi:rfaE bifunctional protein kinase chain/domain